ncbi:histone H1 [Aquimixticola soesokkakensis]|uniref:histone H1 n=1 Tax=Aquimixticola soesokkakensis TaxID=1519096 RepID=UPI00190EA90B|nr:histone H1 [Aquimixticola soesokkakensis]
MNTMPKGPQGQKRPADVIGNAVHIARIATGEEQETSLKQPAKRKSGLAGAKARQDNTTAEDRSEIAKKAAAARWG